MQLGVMLLKKSGKHGSLKFFVTIIAAMLGTLILLSVFSMTNALNTFMSDRASWKMAMYSDGGGANNLSREQLTTPGAVVYTVANQENVTGNLTFMGKMMFVYDMNFTGGELPKGSPLQHYPGAGEYYVSPALEELMNKYSDDVLRDRFPGKQIGTIPSSALSSPDELTIIRGFDFNKLDDTSSLEYLNAKRITNFSLNQLQQLNKVVTTSMMAAGAIGLIIPIMMLITTATSLGAREREERYAALRLIGATKQQIRRITFIDSLAASIGGILLGSIIFLIFRPILFDVSIAGMRFYPEDIIVEPAMFALIIVGVIVMVWFANRSALNRVIASPLGVARKQFVSKPPRIWSLIPLLLCLAGFMYFNSLTKDVAYEKFGNSFPLMLLGLFVLTMISIMLSGAWLTKLYGKLIGIFNKKSDGLLVSRRISHEARKIYKGIGGVVVAFFAGAFFMTSITTLSQIIDIAVPTLTKALPDSSIMISDSEDSKQLASFRDVFGDMRGYQSEPVVIYPNGQESIISCKDIKRLINKTCSDESRYISVPESSTNDQIDLTKYAERPVAIVTDGETITPVVTNVYIPKSGETVDLIAAERAVTAVSKENTTYIMISITSSALRKATVNSSIGMLESMLYAGIILTVVVASLNLIIATVAGLFDRKGSFFTLHLSGAGLPFLKRIVTKESMLPLVFISIVSIGLGIFAAYSFLRIASYTTKQAFMLPGLLFWACAGAVIILSYVGIRMMLPMLDKLTSIEQNRSE